MTKKGASAASSPAATADHGGGTARFVCSMCAKVYRSGAGLRYHKRKRHRGKLVLSDLLTQLIYCSNKNLEYLLSLFFLSGKAWSNQRHSIESNAKNLAVHIRC